MDREDHEMNIVHLRYAWGETLRVLGGDALELHLKAGDFCRRVRQRFRFCGDLVRVFCLSRKCSS